MQRRVKVRCWEFLTSQKSWCSQAIPEYFLENNLLDPSEVAILPNAAGDNGIESLFIVEEPTVSTPLGRGRTQTQMLDY